MSVNGGRKKAQRRIWVIVGGAAMLAGAVGLLSGQGRWAAVLVAVGVVLPIVALLSDKAAARSGDLDVEKVADRLADLVRDQWDIEATRRGVGRPPLEVFWQAADADLVHSWPELQQQAATGRSGPASPIPGNRPDDLAGQGALLPAYDRSPCGRLVVLGEPGAGKTVLLLRLVLDLLDRRQPGQPVPLLVPLASWNPDSHSLYAWLEAQIRREYPHLAAVDAATGRKRAGALLDAGLITPVLDGLDEIRARSRDQALVAINEGLRSKAGLILSSRSEEFRAAVRSRPDVRPIRLDGAAGIQVASLSPNTVRTYLLAGARDDGPDRWTHVLAALADHATPIAQAFGTPLAASVANAIYNPRPGESALGLPNPTDLTTLPTAAAVEQHLLAGFVPAAYRHHPDQPGRWNAEQATGYLTFLAHHLEHRLHTTSLAWWELSHATPGALPILAIWFAAGLVFGLAAGHVFGFSVGLAVGLMFGLSAGLAAVLTIWLAAGLVFGLTIWLAAGPGAGIGAGVAVGLAVGLMEGIEINTTADTRLAVAPKSALTQVRTNANAFGLTFGLAFGLVFGLAVGTATGPVTGLTTGLAFGLALGLAAVLTLGLTSAWGRLGLARLWLAARRQQPLHLMAFLEDAHARGVLRQAGAVWEFRHASLQRYLADLP